MLTELLMVDEQAIGEGKFKNKSVEWVQWTRIDDKYKLEIYKLLSHHYDSVSTEEILQTYHLKQILFSH